MYSKCLDLNIGIIKKKILLDVINIQKRILMLNNITYLMLYVILNIINHIYVFSYNKESVESI